MANAVSKDQDPIHTLILTSGGGAVNTQTDVQVSGIAPSTGTIGDSVRIFGINFDPRTVEVAFVGATAWVDEGQSTANSLLVTVPPGARGGLIRVSLNGKDTYSQPFKVTTEDGHRISFTNASGSTYLYAVSNTLGTLLRIDPDGSTRTLNTSLSDPRAVLVNPEGAAGPNYKLYVADAGSGKIVQLDQSGTVSNAAWLSAAVPSAVVLGPDGDVYVAQRTAGTILRAGVTWGSSTVAAPSKAVYTGFTDPVALAFDYLGNLYVVERSQGRVRRFMPGAGDAGSVAPETTDWAFLSNPDGIAIDTGGNSFVTSATNNVIFRVDRFRNTSAFKTVPGARSIARDPAGNLYVADSSRNLIDRLTLSGDQRIVA